MLRYWPTFVKSCNQRSNITSPPEIMSHGHAKTSNKMEHEGSNEAILKRAKIYVVQIITVKITIKLR